MDANATNYNANATVDDASCAFPDPDGTTPDGNETNGEDDVTPEPSEQSDREATADLLGPLGTVGGALLLGLVLMGLSWAIRRTAS